ncbi:MAG: hypothetical protein AB7K24_25170 [Gemmataceae bacterium]
MAKKRRNSSQPVRRPEMKVGPFHNGLGVSVWLNVAETSSGPRYFRSVTIAARRYRDPQTGEWKDAGSYRPVDIPTLILALKEAQEFLTKTPLPGQPVEGDEFEDMHLDDGEVPSEVPAEV